MTLQSGYDSAKNTAFLEKMEQAIVVTAIKVQAELLASATVPSASTLTQQEVHDKRSELAYDVLNNPQGYAVLFAKGVASDPNSAGVDHTSSDNDIKFTVESIWNAFAINGIN